MKFLRDVAIIALGALIIYWIFGIAGILVAAGLTLGLVITLIVFGLLTPLFITSLVNEPDGKDPSGFHMFTYPEEGKVKLIVRGDVLIRMVMLYADHVFAKEGERKSADDWLIVRANGRDAQDPLEGIVWFLRPWAQYVYWLTGAVFTGIYPFQTVREYTLERTKMHRDESDPKRASNIVLWVEEDISDHFRARQFLYPFRVAAADTKDKIPVDVLAVIKARVTNPHKAAFGTDRWDIQMVNLATNAVTNFTRANDLDEVLSAKNKKDAKRLNEAVQEIKEDEEKYGIEIDGVDLIDISPNLSEENLSKLYAEALAKRTGAATLIDAQKRAEGLKAINEANATGGEYAIETLRTEALVRAAREAKDGTVLLPAGGTSTTDMLLAALLAERKHQPQGNTDNG